MPELPEVETVRRTLAPLCGARVREGWSSGKLLRLRQVVPPQAYKGMCGRTIAGVRRMGKYLLIDTDGPTSLLVHLGMSGRLRLFAPGQPLPPHAHVAWQLEDGRRLVYSDPRRFGQVDCVTRGQERGHPALAKLGLDPLTDAAAFTADALLPRAQGRSTPLKSWLLDQTVFAGLGNIYVAEALWRAKLSPHRQAKTLTKREAGRLATAIVAVIADALTNGGTSLRDFVDADGREGSNASYLQVYGRSGEPCPRCGRLIEKSVQAGRATYRCVRCQPD